MALIRIQSLSLVKDQAVAAVMKHVAQFFDVTIKLIYLN